ncbi:META domain-containing protein [Idiomarina sp. HP20-50]|uniref:META domain-containing protein n=1 Tax=Idiomarina sp. HP20-50 TaxID=3070813 RepID=UPI00294B0D75|nr:META domain-containing protein [Idiomarina sp. HP20-50]MDV6316719.1 META domain-containing protein [Idiomarina sp. HP20-50]
MAGITIKGSLFILAAMLLSGCALLSPTKQKPTYYQCGAIELSVQHKEQNVLLNYHSEQAILTQKVSGSGARYSNDKDPVTQYWNKGSEATITWEGQDLPLCVERGTLPKHFTARGNEPFWQVAVNPQHMALTTPESEAIIDLKPAQVVSKQPYEWRIESTTGKHLIVIDRLCRDSMSGRLYPYQVDLQESDRMYSGCGGDSEWLLQGAVWQLSQFEGQAIHSKPPTIQFLEDGQLAGFNGCNRYFGHYNMGGELAQLRITGSTKMACSDTADELSRRFSEVLGRVYQVNIDDKGRLILSTRGGRKMVFKQKSE